MSFREICQLASAWDFQTLPCGGMLAEEKIDGFRAVYLRDWRGVPRLFTRGGQPIEGVGHILHRLDIMERCAGEPMVFDGEFQVDGCLSATKAWCERGWKGGGEAGTLHLFDCMPAADWKAGGSTEPHYRRRQRLEQLMAAADAHPLSWEWRPRSRGKEPSGPAVVMVEGHWVGDVADVMDAARRIWSAGGEGLMLKDAESPYLRGRQPFWRKVKSPDYRAR